MTPTWDNIDTFFNEDDFAVSVVYTPSGGTARSILVIPEDMPVDSSVSGTQYSTTRKLVRCKTADMEEEGSGEVRDVLVLEGVTYYVIDRQPGSDDTTILTLSKDM